MMFDGTNITLLIAFVSGIITFFASCLLPLVPVYLAYISGVALSSSNGKDRWRILRTSIFFVIGFISVFILLGATLTSLNRVLIPYRIWIERGGGLLFIALGLYMIGFFKSSFLSKELHLKIGGWFKNHSSLHAIVTGIVFAFGWTPCIGPVLGVILFWASRQASFSNGLLMLIVYGLGLGLPFIAVGLGFDKIMPYLKKSARLGRTLQIISGIVIVAAGILLFSGHMQRFSLYLIDLLNLRPLSR